GVNHKILAPYNPTPPGWARPIKTFARLHVPNKWLFLGAMMEMGADSLAEHAQLIALIEKYNWAQVVLVGGDFAHVPHSYLYFNNAQDAAQWWKAQQLTGQYLLVKGSRSMKMETIVA
ncbi:MAG TPA: UDP-N-acetylmuramoylalanyl-D-glutamate--2,6-diaminopimelate ligase, partial [Phnomibacter sp.]|nr:UDP-N-acetylmuramoylalanyl-D-glutamate--2,6-diaminopimelate ligase [Phnomibacter sp.]